MKIRRVSIPLMTIEEFAESHDLTMVVTERNVQIESQERYRAEFENCEVIERGCLCSRGGYGKSPEEAIEDYANRIQLQRLVFGAYTTNRREILAPCFLAGAKQ